MKRKPDIRRDLTVFEEMVIQALERASLKPYVSVVAISGSCYVKFKEPLLRSLRIGDHNGRKKYRYKWNLRHDCEQQRTEKDGNVVRYHFPASQVKNMVQHMTNYLAKIQGESA